MNGVAAKGTAIAAGDVATADSGSGQVALDRMPARCNSVRGETTAKAASRSRKKNQLTNRMANSGARMKLDQGSVSCHH
jgi:hypothetical protein